MPLFISTVLAQQLNNVTLLYACDDACDVTLANQTYLNTGAWNLAKSITVMLPVGDYVIGINGLDTGGTAAVAATLIVNGAVITKTGSPGWLASAWATPGWSTNYNFINSTWSTAVTECWQSTWVNLLTSLGVSYDGLPPTSVW
jgi:hypothetical protein